MRGVPPAAACPCAKLAWWAACDADAGNPVPDHALGRGPLTSTSLVIGLLTSPVWLAF